LELNDLWVNKYDEIIYNSLDEATFTKNMEPCIGIIGNTKYFSHLETPTLGILAQESAVATSVKDAVEAIGPDRNLLFFPARFRHYASQAPDGYAAGVAGVKAMSTDSNGEYWGYNGIGTIPHLLIAAYGGDTPKAALKFDEMIDPNVDRVILVDWDNDCIGTTIRTVAAFLSKLEYSKYYQESSKQDLDVIDLLKDADKCRYFVRNHRHVIKNVIGKGKGKIFGVRFDTSGSLIDKSLPKLKENFGVCPQLVFEARRIFDELGMEDLKIFVSGGFDLEKIEYFNKFEAPYDMIGIGSSIVNKFHSDFTADAVMLDNEPNAKIGRELQSWRKLILR
jgi:nicotinate phosphoribosyltransferase